MSRMTPLTTKESTYQLFTMLEATKKNKKIGLISFTSNLFTFGLRSIESYLKNLGYDVFIVHCSTRRDNPISLLNDYQLKMLAEKCQGCDMVGISVISSHNLKRTEQVNNFLLKNTKTKVIVGGVPVILDPHYFLKFADYVCLGEGETFFKYFLEADDESFVPGLGYKREGKIIFNKLPPLVDVNQLPIPYFDFENTYSLQEETFTSLAENPEPLHISCSKGYRIFSVIGCAFSCTYCANNKLKNTYKGTGRLVRILDTERVMKELEYAKSIVPGLKKIFFMADDFTMRPLEEFRAFITEYQKRISLPCTFYSTHHSFTKDKLDVLLENKVKIIWMKLGLQIASERVNKQVYKRDFDKDMFLDKVELIISHNIHLRLDMILQNPYEEILDWVENLDFFYEIGKRIDAHKLPKNLIRLNLFALRFYPGTELYDRALRDGIIDESYIEKVLLSRSKYNYGTLGPYTPTMFSIDILLIYIYYFLMLIGKKGKIVYYSARKTSVLKFLNRLCSFELLRFIYSNLSYVASRAKRMVRKIAGERQEPLQG